MNELYTVAIVVAVMIFLSGIRIVRPTRRGLVERLGRYQRFARAGFNWIIPVVDRLFLVNVTEQMVDAEPQEIITNDNLNALVDAQIYFKIKDDETSVKDSQYNVNNVTLPDRQSRTHDAAQHHRHADAQIGQQRARARSTRSLLKVLMKETHELGHRHRARGVEADRPAQRRAGDHEQDRQGGERKDRGGRLRHRSRNRSRRFEARGHQAGGRRPAGEDSGSRRRGRGDPPGERSRQ